MESRKISAMAAALVALVAVSGLAYSSFAQESASSADVSFGQGKGRGMNWENMSEAERAKLEAEREARRSEREEKRAAVEAALKAGDYQAWRDAHESDDPILEKINQDNFSKLIQAHNYFENGRALMAELGVERTMGKGLGMGKGGFGASCHGGR